MDKRKHEGGGLSTTSSSLGKDIFSGQGKGDGLCLDRCGLCKVHLGQSSQETVIESKVSECEVVIDSIGRHLRGLGLADVFLGLLHRHWRECSSMGEKRGDGQRAEGTTCAVLHALQREKKKEKTRGLCLRHVIQAQREWIVLEHLSYFIHNCHIA